MKQIYKMATITLILAIAGLMMTGCQSDDQTTKEEVDVKKEVLQEPKAEPLEVETEPEVGWAQEVRPLPVTLKEVVEYPVGKFTSEGGKVTEAELQEITNDIPVFAEVASEEEMEKLFEHLYSLFKMEYEDPLSLLQSTVVSQGPNDTEGAEIGRAHV